MKFYTSVNVFGNSVLVRGVNNGKNVLDRVSFKPTLFVKSKEKTKYKSIYGDYLDSIKFEDIREARDFVQRYKDVQNFEIFGNTNFAYQYITETFPNDVEFDISQIKIWTVDIETSADDGFPDINNPTEKVLLITIQDNQTKKLITFGLKEYENSKDNLQYIQCRDESDLLKRFLEYFESDYPHIITGWNVEFFDIPYLCNRIERILGEDAVKKLSPWGNVSKKNIIKLKKENVSFEVMGIAILDYLDLYKKFTYTAQESYKLDHIAKVELGKQKLSYDEYGSFTEFWNSDWQKFVEYNIRDVEIVDELEDKMKLIELILTMAYDAKVTILISFLQFGHGIVFCITTYGIRVSLFTKEKEGKGDRLPEHMFKNQDPANMIG